MEAIADIHLKRQGFSPFNPQYRTKKIVRGETIVRTRPYITGYIFIRFDPEEPGIRWRAINSTHGVNKLFTTEAERPMRISDSAMSAITDQCDAEGFVKRFEADQALAQVLNIGDIVKVRSGSFEGFTAPVIWTDGQRAKVMMTFFGRSNEVEFQKKQLERVA